jgi:PAS domain S-box-containing protein
MTQPADGPVQLHVLYLEDSPLDAELVQETLVSGGFALEMDVAPDKPAFEAPLAGSAYDLILADFSLPGFDARGALELAQATCTETPFICVSGVIGEEATVELLKQGADDVVLKDHLARLPFAVRRALGGRATARALRESEQHFAAFFEEAPLGYQSLDAEGRFLEVNAEWLALLGYAREEVIGRWFGDFLAPEYVEPFRERFPLFKERSTIHSEFEMLRKDGERRFIAFEGRIARTAEGAFRQTHCILADVSAQRRAEAALRESEERLRFMVDQTPTVNWTLDSELRFSSSRGGGLKVLGLEPDQVVGMYVGDYLGAPSAQADLGVAMHERALAGETFIYEQQVGELTFDIILGPLRDANQAVVGVIGVGYDATERKRAEEANARLAAIVASSEDAIFSKTLDGTILTWNAGAELLYGYASEEIVGSSVALLTPPGTDDELASLLERVARGDAVQHYETTRVRKDGSRVDVSLSISPIKNAAGVIVAAATIARDVTARKQAEDARAESERRLRSLFEDSPVALWEEDHSAVKTRLEELLAEGVEDVESYLREHTDEYERCMDLGRTLDANLAAVALFEAPSRDEAIARQGELYPAGSVSGLPAFWAGLLAGQASASSEETNLTLEGHTLLVLETASVARGHEDDWGRVYLADVDVTARRQAEQQLREALARQRLTTTGMIVALSRSVEVRDPYTAGHQRRVSELGVAIARELELDADCLRHVEVAGLLHDVGKIVIPAEILSRPGRLSQMEFALIKGHSQAAYDILESIDFDFPLAEIVVQHHERLDGSGYPAGLAGDAILLEARILAVADVIEAMANHRPYRAALPLEEALAEIEAGAGTRFDGDVCAAALRLFRDQGFTFTE